MALSDRRARHDLLKSISENGKVIKIAALRLCDSASQLDRIANGKIIESCGFYTTAEDIEDMTFPKSRALLANHCTNGIGGRDARKA
jgi:hypothetical protein